MKNVLQEAPARELRGTSLFASRFVEDADLRDRNVLDIGCGYGAFLLHTLERGVRAVTGIEPSEEAMGTAREHVRDAKATLKLGSAIALPFDDEQFDTVYSWEVIEHIPKQSEQTMFKEVLRVLRPGGAFYLSTPHRSIRSNVLDPAWWMAGHRHYSARQLSQFGIEAGFVLEKEDVRGGWWQATQINNMYVSKWILRRKPLLAEWFNVNVEAEIERGEGFYNLFAKFRKPGGRT